MQHELLLGDAIRFIVRNDSSGKEVATAARFKQLESDLKTANKKGDELLAHVEKLESTLESQRASVVLWEEDIA